MWAYRRLTLLIDVLDFTVSRERCGPDRILEPAAGNASYWFRRVGDHPLLRQLGVVLECWAGELGAGAEELTAVLGLVSGGRLDPFRLIQLSTQAIRSPGSSAERALRLVQHLELVQLLLWDVG
jgi:hypothetical protein